MKYITYNDSPGGVYQSQVIDVCRFLQNTFNISVELVAFVSLRTYFKDKKNIKKLYTNSTILPAFPGINNWKMNVYTFKLYMLFKSKDTAITRGVFATLLALRCKRISSVCFDVRGAYATEWKEYLHTESEKIASEMNTLERQALMQSKLRIAVSEKLVEYWREQYSYDKNAHVVIPCTIESSKWSMVGSHLTKAENLRKQWGIKDTDVLLVFSGSSAGWQSLKDLYEILTSAFKKNDSLKLLMLSYNPVDDEFSKAFPGRIIKAWAKSSTVNEEGGYNIQDYLSAGDYGLLYRENTVTNNVSSPVKFAEYLAAGLPVIISENIGDYSLLAKEKKCGQYFSSIDWENISRPQKEERTRIQEIAYTYFRKSAYKAMYGRVVEMK